MMRTYIVKLTSFWNGFLQSISLLVIATLPVAGQVTIPNVIPPSPTAAALERYSKVPVSTFTGVPNISLPLYKIQVRDLSIPISLNYHAGGFRVSDEASWIGLGWSLMAGGAITRTVRNLDDLQYFVRPNNTDFPFIMPDHTAGQVGTNSGNGFNEGDGYSGMRADIQSNQALWVNGTLWNPGNSSTDPNIDQNSDWEPDDFRFSMGQYSGRFAFRQDGTVHLLDQQKIQIIPPAPNQPRPQTAWRIITPDGSQYFFTAQEVAGQTTPVMQRQFVTTAWYLTKIISPLGEEATLDYATGSPTYNQASFIEQDFIERFGNSCGVVITSPYSSSYSTGWSVPKYLERINFKTGYVLFRRDVTNPRSDLRGGQKLQQIAVYTSSDALVKTYDLQTSYFVSPAAMSSNLPANDPGIPYEDKRLRLDAVQETGSNGVSKPATSFSYNTTALPPKSSFGIDNWGYYNSSNSRTLLPEYWGTGMNGLFNYSSGASRNSNEAAMKACVLERITYPTGGNTSFEFEANQYSNILPSETVTLSPNTAVRYSRDNVNSNYNISSSVISVSVSTPLKVSYTLTAETLQSQRETQLQIINDATNAVFWQWSFPSGWNSSSSTFQGQETVLLPPGTYRFDSHLMNSGYCNSTQCHGYVAAIANYAVLVPATNFLKLATGGLRIRRIETYDGVDIARNQVQTYDYGTSGILMSRPLFIRRTAYYIGSSGSSVYNSPCYTLTRLSYNQSCLSAGAQGSTVGYTSVTVLNGSAGEGGKTEYKYYCEANREPTYGDPLPNLPLPSHPFNGCLLEETTYRKSSTGYQRVTKTENEYEWTNAYTIPGMHRGSYYVANTSPTTGYRQPFYYYALNSQWVRLMHTTKRQYDQQDASKSIVTSTIYRYNPTNQQVRQAEAQRSDGSTMLTTTTYPSDYTGVTSGSLASMRTDAVFQHDAVVESTTSVYGPGQKATDAKTISGSYTEYSRPSSTGKYLPSATHTLQLTQPTSLPAAAPALPPANRYTLQAQLSYDPATANLRQVQKAFDVSTGYIWGHDNTLPIAEVKNATPGQIAFTSFELNSLGTWTYDATNTVAVPFTGRLCFGLGGSGGATVQRTGLAAGTYELLLWAHGTGVPQLTGTTQQRYEAGPVVGDWHQHRYYATVAANATLTLSTPGYIYIDEVRLHPATAQMTSYTYEPLGGMTSQTDANGRTTTYEYDGLQRLHVVRDQELNILQKYDYHYKP